MWLHPWTIHVPTVWRASRAPEAPKPEFDPNSIFQSLSNLTSGGHTGNPYSDLERFGDVLGFVGNGFLKKWFFDRKKNLFFSANFWIFKIFEKSRKSRKSDFLKFRFFDPKNFTFFSKHIFRENFFTSKKNSRNFSEHLCRSGIFQRIQKSYLENQPIKLKVPKIRITKSQSLFV